MKVEVETQTEKQKLTLQRAGVTLTLDKNQTIVVSNYQFSKIEKVYSLKVCPCSSRKADGEKAK